MGRDLFFQGTGESFKVITECSSDSSLAALREDEMEEEGRLRMLFSSISPDLMLSCYPATSLYNTKPETLLDWVQEVVVT